MDDEPIIQDMGRELLSNLYYKVSVSEAGGRAVAFYKERHKDIVLVILILVMPRLSGE